MGVLARRVRQWFAALAAALLAGCAGAPPPSPPVPMADNGEQCLARLDARHILYEPAPMTVAAHGCGVVNAVRLLRTEASWGKPPLMTCALAGRLDEFERAVLQPAALHYFGVRIVAVEQLGAYSCRRETSGSGRLSQHASGRAIDLAGFDLADGRRILVKSDWDGSGASRAFLHDVGKGACSWFDVVLSPDHDGDHRDHLHLDIGPYRLCGVE
jgi:hypothetical protein